jgi:hypothetical protein
MPAAIPSALSTDTLLDEKTTVEHSKESEPGDIELKFSFVFVDEFHTIEQFSFPQESRVGDAREKVRQWVTTVSLDDIRLLYNNQLLYDETFLSMIVGESGKTTRIEVHVPKRIRQKILNSSQTG